MSVPHAQIVTLLKVTVNEGLGKDEDDPVRNVDYYYERDGALLWRWDEWEEAQANKCSCTRCSCTRCALRFGKPEEAQ